MVSSEEVTQDPLVASNSKEDMSVDEQSVSSDQTMQASNTANTSKEPESEEARRTANAPPQAENSMNVTASVSVGLALVKDLFGSLDIEEETLVEGTLTPPSVINRIKSLKEDSVNGEGSKVSVV
jgi:hypothetical protein